MANFFIHNNACYTFAGGVWYITERNKFSNANRTTKVERAIVIIAAGGLMKTNNDKRAGERLVVTIERGK